MTPEEKIEEVLGMVREQLVKAMAKHRRMHSAHEGYAVILEELEELWEHVKADTGTGPEARKEALQIAAMGIRYVLDLTPVRPACAACDRGDYQLGHADGCPAVRVTQDLVRAALEECQDFLPRAVTMLIRNEAPESAEAFRQLKHRVDAALSAPAPNIQPFKNP